MEQVIMITPDYYEKFHCAASRCAYNCCCGSWRIDIDKKSYEIYENSPHEAFFLRHIAINADAQKDRRFARIKLEKNVLCPFLDTDRLCSIQKTFGEGYLSDVCRTYPRSVVFLEGNIEKSLAMSCPEVVKLVLFQDGAVCFQKSVEANQRHGESLKEHGTGNHYLFQLKYWLIGFLKNKTMGLEEKLYRMGCILQDIDQTAKPARNEKIQKLVRDYKDIPQYQTGCRGHQGNPNLADTIKMVAEIANFSFRVSNWSQYTELGRKSMSGLGFNGNQQKIVVTDRVIEKFLHSNSEYCTPFLKKYPDCMENYAACYLFTYFTQDKPSLLQQYCKFVMIYAVTRFVLIGLAAFYLELTEEMVHMAVALVIRSLIHNSTTMNIKLAQIDEKGNLHMDYLAKFIFTNEEDVCGV